MESLVTKVLSKYFRTFIKGFKNEQFNMSLMKGTASLSDLDLNELYIQEILMVPPNLEVKVVKCNALTVSLPNLTRLNQDPMVLSLDRIDIELEEPVELRQMVVKQQDPSTPNLEKKKKKSTMADMIKNMRVEIKEAHLSIKLLARVEEGDSNWTPHMIVDVYNVVIQTTNSGWEVVDLGMCKVKNDASNTEIQHKQVVCQSFSLGLVSQDNETKLPIISNIPAEIRMAAVLDIVEDKYIKVSVDSLFEEINFSWNELSWQLIVKMFSSLKRCLDREVPGQKEEKPADYVDMEALQDARLKKMAGALTKLEIAYNLHIERWSIEFRHGLGNDNAGGYIFHGYGFAFEIAPRRRILEEQEGQMVPLYESVLKVILTSMAFRELNPSSKVDPRYAKVIAQVDDPQTRVSNKDDLASSASSSSSSEQMPNFIDVSIRHIWSTLTDPKSTVLNVKINGLQVVVDRQVWKGLYMFLSGGVIDIIKKDIAAAKAAPKEEKKEEKDPLAPEPQWVGELRTKKMSDYFYWYYNSNVNIEVNNTVLILPKDYDDMEEIILTQSLHAYARKLSLTNRPSWSLVPYLKEGLQSLPSSDYLSFTQDGSTTSNKFQLDFQDLHIETIDGEGSSSKILEPSTIRFYGRLLDSTDSNGAVEMVKPQLELAIHAGTFVVTITENQENYFKHMIPVYQSWYNRIHISDESKALIKEKLREGAIEAAQAIKAKKDKLTMVEDAMKAFQCAVIFHAERGIFRVSLHNIGFDDEEEGKIAEAAVSSEPGPLSSLTFTGLGLIVENSAARQSVMARLLTLQADGLDHPKSPMSLKLLPLVQAQQSSSFLDEACHHLSITCQRLIPKEGHPFTEIAVRLQGMQVTSQAKKGGISGLRGDIEALIPDLQRVAKKITSTLIGIKKDEKKMNIIKGGVEKLKEGVEKGVEMAEKALEYLDLSWEFEIADCEVQLLDADWSEDKRVVRKPFGTIKVSTFNRRQLTSRFASLETELIDTKMSLAQSEAELDEMRNDVKELKDKLRQSTSKSQGAEVKIRNEMANVEQLLIETKLKLAELQSENDELRRKIRR